MTSFEDPRVIRVAEFYSGIGGWRCGATRAAFDLYGAAARVEVALAVDVSTTCNATYAHNFGDAPVQRPIEDLDPSRLEGLDGWLLSPPCQPHTRQRCPGEAAVDAADPRSKSFLWLADRLARCEAPPAFVCLENVVGFAGSACCARWHGALRDAGFAAPRAWHCSPTMVGVPHERPRYFECAVRRPGGAAPWRDGAAAPADGWPGGAPAAPEPRRVADFLEAGDAAPWRLPPALLARDAAWCLDVVDAESTAPTACFTRSYGRFARGTGSVLNVTPGAPSLAALGLARADPAARVFGDGWKAKLDLRFFAPKEIANLLGFPATFAFPANVATKARWAAVGNSLHVGAAAAVVAEALRDLG